MVNTNDSWWRSWLNGQCHWLPSRRAPIRFPGLVMTGKTEPTDDNPGSFILGKTQMSDNLNTNFALRCCELPRHLNSPLTIMVSLVQRASHSSMLCDVRTTDLPAMFINIWVSCNLNCKIDVVTNCNTICIRVHIRVPMSFNRHSSTLCNNSYINSKSWLMSMILLSIYFKRNK